MKLYDGGRAPNPRRTRIFLAEKGITLPLEQVDLGAMAQKSPAYAAINPLKRVPALVLDDGTVITESIAICRYFEALKPDPPLFGRGALELARIEMWNRRVELNLFSAAARAFQHTNELFKARLKQRWWNPAEPRLFTPKTFGWGYDINLARLLRLKPKN